MSDFETARDDLPSNMPVMIVAFAGWNDAGGASTWAVRHLIEKTDAQSAETIDSENYYDFSRERPTVHLDGDTRSLRWPENTISLSSDSSVSYTHLTLPTNREV